MKTSDPLDGWKPFAQIDVKDPFFDTLRKDYQGFEDWFERKAQEGANAFVMHGEDGTLQAFLFLKVEEGVVDDVEPPMQSRRRLKVGTLKINAHGTKLGERFIKKITDAAVLRSCREIYVTVFPKHTSLVALLTRYGFVKVAKKGEEDVLMKNLDEQSEELLHTYPILKTQGCRKFLLAVKPEYHTRLFPDSILNNERNNAATLIKDNSTTNGIHKIYICFMRGADELQRGDIVVIYRTSDHMGPAHYRAVVSSVCQIEEVRSRSTFADAREFEDYVGQRSIFTPTELKALYEDHRNAVVIKMTYNFALPQRITRGRLIEEAHFDAGSYWGLLPIDDKQFNFIIQQSGAHEGFIVH